MAISDIKYIPKGMLKRKFDAPSLPLYHVPEETITDIVLSKSGWGVCLIHAKGGVGKTTLLAQWHATLKGKDGCFPIWVSLEDRDALGSSFARVLATAFQQIDGRFVELIKDFSESDDVRTMLVDLVNLFDEVSDPETTYYLLLDDYDSAASPDMDAVLLFLNKYTAQNLKLIVAGSYLSSKLDDLLLDASVLEFRARDLVFSDSRLEAFIDALGPSISNDVFSQLKGVARDWPLAFVFASLAAKRAIDGEEAERITRSYIHRYFDGEVLKGMDPEVVGFLVDVSLLDVIDIDLAGKITSIDGACAILKGLCAHNQFIERIGNSQYVLDHLFLESLRRLLVETRPNQISVKAAIASKWYRKTNQHAEEAKYLALSCEQTFLEDMAMYSTGRRFPESHPSFIAYLLEQPSRSFLSDPYLIWVSIWAYIASGMVRQARNAIGQLDASQTPSAQHALAYADSLCLALEGRNEQSLSMIRHLMEEASSEMPQEFTCLFLHMEGEDCERLGRIVESRELLIRALSYAERMEGSFYRLFDMYLLSRHYLFFDDFDKALDYAQRILNETSVWNRISASAHATIARICASRGQFAEASAHLGHIDTGEYSLANIDMFIDAVVAKTHMDWAMGERIEALTTIQHLSAQLISEEATIPRNVQLDAYSLFVKLSANMNDLTGTSIYVQELERGSGLPDLFRSIPCMISLAVYKWALGESKAAHDQLARTKDLIESSELSGSYWLTEIYVLEAAYYAEEGRRSQGSTSLNRAIDLAMHNGYTSIFLAGGHQVKTLLLERVTNRKSSSAIRAYAKRLLSFFGEDEGSMDMTASKGDAVQGYHSLTEREREILHLLNSGMSRQELSEYLVISQNTAKTHLKNIYAKLGVHTRAEAYRVSIEHEAAENMEDMNANESPASSRDGLSPSSPSSPSE